MENHNIDIPITFYELKWDTEYFGINSAKAILNKPLTLPDWENLKKRFDDYQFISIENLNSEPINSQLIGKDTKAFLADVNIQFKKKLNNLNENQVNIEIYQALERNDKIVKMAEFPFSRFIEDNELAKRGGDQIYRQWVINSFDKQDKYFAISKNSNSEINGFLLYSYINNVCTVELIAVSKDECNRGIGTNLFKAVENAAFNNDCIEIRVGTQIRNINAINFYHKVGCKQVGCTQVFHLWNL